MEDTNHTHPISMGCSVAKDRCLVCEAKKKTAPAVKKKVIGCVLCERGEIHIHDFFDIPDNVATQG